MTPKQRVLARYPFAKVKQGFGEYVLDFGDFKECLLTARSAARCWQKGVVYIQGKDDCRKMIKRLQGSAL